MNRLPIFPLLAVIVLPGSAYAGPEDLFEELERMETHPPSAAEGSETEEPDAAPPSAKTSDESTPSTGDAPDPEAVEAILEFARAARQSAERSREHRARIRSHRAGDHVNCHHSHAVVLTGDDTAEDLPANRAVAERFGVGLEGHAAANIAHTRDDTEVTAIGTGGLWLSVTVHRFLTVGVNHLGAFARNEDADRGIVQGGPFAEIFFFPHELLQMYGELGAPLQMEGGRAKHHDDEDADLAGVAVYTGAGARLWLGDHVTLGASVRGYRVVHGTFRMPPKRLREGREAVMVGTSFGVHF